MQLPPPFTPPGTPDLPPPSPLCQVLALLVALVCVAQLVLFALPETWSQRVRGWLRDVEPFRQVDAWLRAQIK